jgi:predicted aldo/keto reductase-like oxidoreductase
MMGYYTRAFVLETLTKLKEEGVIRYLGFSSHGKPDMLETFADLYPWDFAQIQLNYLDWEYQNAKRQYEILCARNLPIMVMEPVRGGRLADLSPAANQLLQSQAPQKSIASWAMRFAASFPQVQTVLSGCTTLEQVRDNLDTMQQFEPITEKEWRILEQAVALMKQDVLIPCTGCHYCDPCSQGLDIAELMKLYGNYAMSRSDFDFSNLRMLPFAKQPSRCTGCKSCEAHCPQKIKISELMQEMAAIIQKEN